VSKKDKLITDAQKYLQKGQADKAISNYQEALAFDPGDQRLRQRLAELFAKCRHLDESRKEFETIGRNLSANGFYLKAIAVYKQIEKLFPDDIGIALILASLNEKHGLTANAMAEYKRAYDYYDQLQNHVEALKALESMQRIDVHNPNIKLKYAEVLFQQGNREEAMVAFRALGLLLVERRDEAAFTRLSERISQLFPDKPDFSDSVIEQKINDGGAEQAAALLQSLIKANPQRYPVWRLLVMAYNDLGNTARLKMVCQHCIKLFPAQLFPRETLINSLLEEKDATAALISLEESEHIFLSQGQAATLRKFYLILNDLVPINIKILKGCARTCDAAGCKEEAASFAAKIGSLAGLGAKTVVADKPPLAEPYMLDLDQFSAEAEHATGPEILVDERQEEVVVEPVSNLGPRELDSEHFADSGTDFGADFYEIDVELDDDFGETPLAPANTWFETVNDIFDNIHTEVGKVRFGEGMDNGDPQSQYDLGLAFHEMGLYDEAINAFRQAADDPGRRMACLILQGACLRDKGELQLAESALRALCDSPSLTSEDSCALKYELALTLAAQGNQESSHQLLEEIEALNPTFRDVGIRLHISSNGQDESFDFNEEELLDFELK
jgi:tetratricopeptide (TPR) repeat protein